MSELFVRFNDKFHVQRVKLSHEFRGGAEIFDFDGHRGMDINEDAFEILELLDSGLSVGQSIETLARRFGMKTEELEPVVQAIVQQAVKIGFAAIERTKPISRTPVLPECLRLEHSHLPEQATIEMTGKCNLSCKHCYGSFKAGQGESLATEQVMSVMEQVKALHCSDLRVTGGEPLMHHDFWDILDVAVNKHHFNVTITTNGTLITPQAARRIKEIGRVNVHISIDGHTPEINDPFRGLDGAFDKAVAAVKSLKTEGFDVRINHAVHRYSRPHIETMWNFADQLGVPLFIGQLYRMGRCEETAADIHIEPSEFYRTIESVRHRYGGNPHHGVSRGCTDQCIRRCDGGYTKMAIRPNGDVTPCITYPHIPRFVMGNVYKTPIKDIFYNFDRDAMLGANNALEIPGCENCPDITDCKSGCLAISYAETGRLDRRDPFSCARQRAVSGRDFKSQGE
jgi:radical SAM protein with 4Fe4S-binding SPASM domain